MMNLYQLQSFVTVISEGSMTAAADKLFLTQPAISQQIRNLEDDLGVELLVRGVRQVKPTLQGEVLFDFAKKILQQAQQAEVAVKAMGAELKGQIRVGTLNSLGVHLMSPIVGRLLKYNPKLSIKIDYSLADELARDFKKGDLDVVILPEVEKQYDLNLGDVDKKYLMNEEMWLVGSGKNTEMPKQISVSEIGQYPLVFFNKEYPHFNQLLKSEIAKTSGPLEPTFESPNVGTLKRVIESGLGWGFLPSLSIRKQVRMGRLTHVQVKEMNYDVEFYYYSRKSAENKALLEVFFQALQQQDRA